VATAEHQLDVAYNSVNHLKRHAIRTAFPLGTYVDYIFTSRDVRVALMRQVVDVDTSGDFVGTIPSDHNMLMVTVHLA
jgi:endonuclease/exonuclease/phosphatase family metal-dependent hydrolase